MAAGRGVPRRAFPEDAAMSLWPLAIGVGSAAVAVGALAVPAARRIAFGSVGFDWLGHELEFDRIEPDHFTVRLKSGTVLRAFRLDGLAYDTRPEAEQAALHQGRADFLAACAARGVTVRLYGVKRRQDSVFPATWPSQALSEIGAAEAALYRSAFALSWYLTLQSPAPHQLEDADDKLHALLGGYRPRRLSRPTDPEAACPLTGFLNGLICGDYRADLRAVSVNISANLPAADLIFTPDGTISAHLPTPLLHRVIAVREWPDMVSGHLLHELMAVPGEIELSQIALPTGRDKTLLLLKRGANSAFGSAQAAGECAAAIELLNQGRTALVATQLAIVLRAADEAELNDLTAQVARILADRRVVASVETRGAAAVWFNRLPDRDRLLRPLKLFVENVAALWPFENAPTGLAESQYGKGPVRSFMTGSGQAYRFQFQCSVAPKALGHFVVFAPSNSGKSTLVLHLLGGLAKFEGIRSTIFDSKEGARFMIEALGGLYQPFDRLALNPLDCDDTPINRQRLALLIRLMLGEAGDTAGIEDILAHVAETAFQLPVEARTFDQVFPLTFPAHSEARKSFARWVVDAKGRAGLYANTFNAPRDSLSGFLDRAFLTGINMNEALEDPALGAPVVAHISTAIERMAREGRVKGFAVFIDEAANLLRNPAFRDLAAVMYREYRKFGGAVGMAFQDPGALHKSGIADAVIENTATFFFYPNPQGNRSAYEPFNLNDEQKGFIFGAPEGRKVLLVKRDAATGFEESTVLDIDLAPLGRSLRFYRSGPDAVRELTSLQEKWGEQWRVHL